MWAKPPGRVSLCKRNHIPFYTEQRSVLQVGVSVRDESDIRPKGQGPLEKPAKRVRADAQRNLDGLLKAAMTVFARSGVDAPVREIAAEAGVGVGTYYRHFPQRAELVAAVFRHEVDACADAAPLLADAHAPGEALSEWMQRYAGFIATKRGLASALHSGDPAFETLPGYFQQRLQPALKGLLDAAAAAGEARGDIDAEELLGAAARLCMAAQDNAPDHARRMVSLLVDGLRYGAIRNTPG